MEVPWHRRGLRLFWTWKSRHRTGRPALPHDVRALIREISTANPLWGAPRIHGECQKRGISVSQSTVARSMWRHPCPPSQTWRSPRIQQQHGRHSNCETPFRITRRPGGVLPRRSRRRWYLLDVQPFEGPARRPDLRIRCEGVPEMDRARDAFQRRIIAVTHRILVATRSPPAEFDAQRDEARVIDAIDVRIVLKLLGPLATAESPP